MYLHSTSILNINNIAHTKLYPGKLQIEQLNRIKKVSEGSDVNSSVIKQRVKNNRI